MHNYRVKFLGLLLIISVMGLLVDKATAASIVNFNGSNQTTACGNCVPPDTHGAIGNTQYVQVVNSALQIYSRTAIPDTVTLPLLRQTSLANFFGYTAQPLFDPRVVYDPSGKRWIISAEAMPESSVVQYHYIAVSKTWDALGTYYIYRINVGQNGTFWDFPQLGLSGGAVIVTANIFSSATPGASFLYTSILSIKKSSLYRGRLSYNRYNNLNDPSIAPPLVVDNNRDAYFISASPASSALKLYKLARVGGTKEVLTGPVTIAITSYSIPPPAPQPGTTVLLDTADSRFSNATAQVGTSLWQVHAINGGQLGSTRAIVRFYRIDTQTNSVSESGDIYRSITSHDFNPSIAVNSANKAFVTWVATDANTQAQVRLALKEDQETTFSSSMSVHTSPTYYNPSGVPSAIERWGDYSSIVVDPLDQNYAWGTNQKTENQTTWSSRIFSEFPKVYVAESRNYRIQIFDNNGSHVFMFGSEGSGPSQFLAPAGIAVDEERIYVLDQNSSDQGNGRVSVFNKVGTYLFEFDARTPGVAFNGEIAVDDSKIYLTDNFANKFKIFTKSGVILNEITEGLYWPFGVEVDDNYVYVADLDNRRVRKYDKNGVPVSEFSTLRNPNSGSEGIYALALDDSRVYLTMLQGEVRVFSKGGVYVSSFGSTGDAPGQFYSSYGLDVDGRRVFIADHVRDQIEVYAKDGSFLFQFGFTGSQPGQLGGPYGLAIDH